MKRVYFDYETKEKLFDHVLEKNQDAQELHVIKDIPEIGKAAEQFFSQLDQGVYSFLPHK